MLAQCLIALAQELDILFAPDKTGMRGRIDELFGGGQIALLDQIGPELQADFEGGIDREGLTGVDAAVCLLGRVVELAVGRVAGTGIVPAIGAFTGNMVKTFDHTDLEARVQLLENHPEGGTHRAGAD